MLYKNPLCSFALCAASGAPGFVDLVLTDLVVIDNDFIIAYQRI